MYSFIKKYTETMQDQNIYPLFSLLVFVVFFCGSTVVCESTRQKRSGRN